MLQEEFCLLSFAAGLHGIWVGGAHGRACPNCGAGADACGPQCSQKQPGNVGSKSVFPSDSHVSVISNPRASMSERFKEHQLAVESVESPELLLNQTGQMIEDKNMIKHVFVGKKWPPTLRSGFDLSTFGIACCHPGFRSLVPLEAPAKPWRGRA